MEAAEQRQLEEHNIAHLNNSIYWVTAITPCLLSMYLCTQRVTEQAHFSHTSQMEGSHHRYQERVMAKCEACRENVSVIIGFHCIEG